MDRVTECYRLGDNLLENEQYGLVSQLRRAAVSVPANIAEGHGRRRRGDYIRHLSVANGSLMELETEFLIAVRLRYLNAEDVQRVSERSAAVGRMLAGLTRSLRTFRR